MKYLLVALLFPISLFGQSYIYLTDDLLEQQHVHTRTIFYPAIKKNYLNYTEYDQKGRLINSINYYKRGDSSLKSVTSYFYNSIYSTDLDSVHFTSFITNKSFLKTNLNWLKSGSSFTVLFEKYDSAGFKVTKQHLRDSSTYYYMYTKDTLNKKVFYILNSNSQLVRVKDEHKNVSEFYTQFIDSSGKVVIENRNTISNTYNKKGQLVEVIDRNKNCTSIKRFSYYKNGLIKSKDLDECEYGWKAVYTYY